MKNIAFRAAVLACALLLPGCGQRHLPAGSENPMAVALIRQQLSSAHSYLRTHGAACPCYVLVGEKDLAREQLAVLSATGLVFLPGGAWVEGHGVRLRIALPRSRWNGNFDVAYEFDCVPGCAASGTAVMRYDGSRWRVLGTTLQ